MPFGRSRDTSAGPSALDCDPLPEVLARSADHAGSAWANASAERVDAKVRLARLAQTLQTEVIPRLVGSHGAAETRPRDALDTAPREGPPVQARDVEQLVAQLRDASDDQLGATVAGWHQRGLPVQGLFLELFAPAARHLGVLWETDACDFSTVTICLGRLQRLLREWSPTFGNEVEHPPNGRRILLAQHPEEQHSFGLSMVAEFFRRDGWEVLGGVGGAVADPSAQVSRDWFDVVGFSVGSETRLPWLRERIVQLRSVTRNRAVAVLAGGPVFTLHPDWAAAIGADACSTDGAQAPRLAEELLTSRSARR